MSKLTHTDDDGRARMVDVSGKSESRRTAIASGTIHMSIDTLEIIRTNQISKGDVIGVARVAAIMGAKKTSDLIPLCHQIALTTVDVEFHFDAAMPGIRVEARATTLDRTGVEMEALTAVTLALLTIYDMAKAIDRGMTIAGIGLIEKTGGASGDWKRSQ